MTPMLWVVIPTYNEAGNLEQLLAEVLAVCEAQVLIVDDNSPDGTGQLVEKLMATNPRLQVHHRSGKLGLGSAYQEGFRRALAAGAKQVIQMDADGSHDPKLIPVMLDGLKNHDLILGSRYIKGGRFPIAWYRRWISTGGNIYIRCLLGWGVHDWSTGYKAWRSDLLQQALAQPMRGQGYAWLMEMTFIARRLGARIGEVPLVFQERRAGDSKFSWRIAAEDISLAWRLFWRRTVPLRRSQ